MAKFKVGDKVVGNEKANRYWITDQGWVGYVVHAGDNGKIGVWKKLEEGIDLGFTVDADCFDLVKPDESDKPPKKYFNGKVVCVESGYNWWTVGKIYDVVDGIITADDGDRYPRLNLGHEPYVDAEDIKHAGCINGAKHNPSNTFIAIVE